MLPGSLNETLEKLNSYGGTHASIVADMGDPESRENVIAEAKQQLGGPIDILVNNAAAAIYQPLAEYPLRRSRLMMEINFHAPLDLSQQALPDMIEGGEGWIVNLSSATANHEPGPPYREGDLVGSYGHLRGVQSCSKSHDQRFWLLRCMTRAFVSIPSSLGLRCSALVPDIKVGEMLAPEQIESMEAMVEASYFCATAIKTTRGKFAAVWT